jgi:TonB family protein
MKYRSKILVCCIVLCAGPFLFAQEPSQEPGSGRATPSRVRLSPRAALALLVKRVEPEYPPCARAQHIQEQLMLMVRISPQGDVSEVTPVRHNRLFGQAAIDAVKQWKYTPYLVNGQPVEVDTPVVITFELPPATATKTPTGVAGDMPGGIPDDRMVGRTQGITSEEPCELTEVVLPTRVRISQGVSQRLLVEKIPPQYPADARRKRIEGTVLMRATINNSGDVTAVDLISGHPLLAPAAIDAVERWKYKPYLLNGKPVEVETQVQVNFTLTGS